MQNSTTKDAIRTILIFFILVFFSCSLQKVGLQTDRFDIDINLSDSTLSVTPLGITEPTHHKNLPPPPAGLSVSDADIGSPKNLEVINFGRLGFICQFDSVENAESYWYALSHNEEGTDLLFRSMAADKKSNRQKTDLVTFSEVENYNPEKQLYLSVFATQNLRDAGRPAVITLRPDDFKPGYDDFSWEFDDRFDVNYKSYVDSILVAAKPHIVKVFGKAFSSHPIRIRQSNQWWIFLYKKWDIELKGNANPNVIIHEICHFLQGLYLPSVTQKGEYNNTLEWLAEGMAQAASYEVMTSMGIQAHSQYGNFYDLENCEELSCSYFRSDGGGMGMTWWRYEMAGHFFRKLSIEYSRDNSGRFFFADLNQLYFEHLTNSPGLDRLTAFKKAISQLMPYVEGQYVLDWIDEQYISFGKESLGRKIHISHQPYWTNNSGGGEFTSIEKIYFYETHPSCRSNWWCSESEKHDLNGLYAQVNIIESWSGDTISTINHRTNPYPNEKGFSSIVLLIGTSTDESSNTQYLKTYYKDIGKNPTVLKVKKTGLYRIDIDFGIAKRSVYRLLGDGIGEHRDKVIVAMPDAPKGSYMMVSKDGTWNLARWKFERGIALTNVNAETSRLLLNVTDARGGHLRTEKRNIDSKNTQLILIEN